MQEQVFLEFVYYSLAVWILKLATPSFRPQKPPFYTTFAKNHRFRYSYPRTSHKPRFLHLGYC